VCDLTCRVNSGISTARALDQYPVPAKKRCERVMELTLHRPLAALLLPAVERPFDAPLRLSSHGTGDWAITVQ